MPYEPNISTSLEWLRLLRMITSRGATADPRGLTTREILGCQSAVSMSHPVVGCRERGLGYRFMAAEAAWILSGDNRVATIAPYSKQIAKFSDDGERFFGAYGPKILDQLAYVVEKLRADPATRHAVLNIWREQPRATRDVPCTISLQWLIRGGALYCFDTMRSSDIWLGWPYDVFNMSMASLYLLLTLRRQDPARFGHLVLGTLTLTAASQHLYEPQFQAAEGIAGLGSHDLLTSHPFEPGNFESPEHLIRWLWGVANNERELAIAYLLRGRDD